MKEYILSDLHLYHKNIIKYCNRPYELSPEGIEKMNNSLFKLFCELPDDNETVIWNLGDVWLSMKMKEWDISEYKHVVQMMKGQHRKINLILGNHDRQVCTYSAFKKMQKSNLNLSLVDFYKEIGFDKVYDAPITIDGNFILSHEPVFLDTSQKTFFNIHGHTHDVMVNETYFTRDEKKLRPLSMGPKKREFYFKAPIEYPNRVVNPKMYFNACLDANDFKILRLVDVENALLARTDCINLRKK